MKKVILETKKLCKTFSNGGVQQHVLKNMDLSIYEGDFTVIMGRSGSGKSTLLYALSGMDTPTMGEILLEGENIAGLKNDQLALMRRKKCGFVFQAMHLLHNMNVLDNVMTGGLLVNRDKKQVAKRAALLLKNMQLTQQDFGKYPDQLSGGEQQRVAIARALINAPAILFADEPTGALNSSASEQVLDAFSALNQEGQSIIIVTHDIKTALRGNRIVYVKDGIICGELILPAYTVQQEADKRARLQQFLGEMGW